MAATLVVFRMIPQWYKSGKKQCASRRNALLYAAQLRRWQLYHCGEHRQYCGL